jgi:hypothetical protein
LIDGPRGHEYASLQTASLPFMIAKFAFSIFVFAALNPCSESWADNGYLLFFEGTGNKISVQDQRQIYEALGLKKANDEQRFILDECDPAKFHVEFKDINQDKIDEIFIKGGNTCTSGIVGSSIWMFATQHKGSYRMNFGFPAAAYTILPKTHHGYPDIEFTKEGFCDGIWRWNGKQYVFARNFPTISGGCNGR